MSKYKLINKTFAEVEKQQNLKFTLESSEILIGY